MKVYEYCFIFFVVATFLNFGQGTVNRQNFKKFKSVLEKCKGLIKKVFKNELTYGLNK